MEQLNVLEEPRQSSSDLQVFFKGDMKMFTNTMRELREFAQREYLHKLM
jgi:hypothetical protein